MKKNNPMYISSTNGAYDFVDFTTPPSQLTNQNPPSQQSHFQHEPFKNLVTSSSNQKFPQPFEITFATLQSTKKSPQILPKFQSGPIKQTQNRAVEAFEVGNKFQSAFTKVSERYEPMSMGNKNFSLNSRASEPEIKIKNYQGGEDYTNDSLIDLLTEPYKSNLKALKKKSRSVSRLSV